MLEITRPRTPAMATSRCCAAVDLRSRAGEIVTRDRRQRRRQDDAAAHDLGPAARRRPARITFDGAAIAGLRADRIVGRGLAHVPGGPRRPPAHDACARTCELGAYRLRARRDRRREPRAGVRAVPALAGAAAQLAGDALGRRAADAGDRPRPDGPAHAADARRALARPVARHGAEIFALIRDICAVGVTDPAGRAERHAGAAMRRPRLRARERRLRAGRPGERDSSRTSGCARPISDRSEREHGGRRGARLLPRRIRGPAGAAARRDARSAASTSC